MQRKIIHKIDYDKIILNVPEDPEASIMFYLSCVCRVSNPTGDKAKDMGEYTKHENYSKMNLQDKQNILSLAYILSPEKFFNNLFVLEPETEHNFENDHYFVEHIELEIDSDGNCTRHIQKIMYFTVSWLETFYAIPMTQLSKQIQTENNESNYNKSFILI